jgi:hypothetical protein
MRLLQNLHIWKVVTSSAIFHFVMFFCYLAFIEKPTPENTETNVYLVSDNKDDIDDKNVLGEYDLIYA